MQEAATFPNNTGVENAPAAMPAFSDPNASRMNIRLSTIILLLLIGLGFSLVVNFLQWFMGPTIVTAVRQPNGDLQVTSYNGRAVESADGAISIQPDAVQPGDKTFCAGEFARLLYAPDPNMRAEQAQQALRMMVEDRAKTLMTCFRRGCEEYDLNLDRQKAESWQTVWTEQAKELDPHDPWTVHITGLQQTTKVINNTVNKETRQISLTVHLVKDPLGRNARNRQLGVQVDTFQYKLISNSAQ